MRRLVLALLLAVPASAVTASALRGRAVAAPELPPEPLRGGPDLLTPLEGERQGRVMSETPGGSVKIAGKGKPLTLEDGEPVAFETDDGEIGTRGPAMATLVARKRRVKVPNGLVITEERLRRSPDRKWAVFTAIGACGDFCYASGWLLGPGLRLQLSKEELGPDVTVAWRPDGQEVAIGSRALFVVSLPDAKVTNVGGFVSPAYGPDGRLYVRDSDKRDAVYEWVRDGKPRKVLAMAGAPPAAEPEFDPGDPEPVTFSADGKLVATFARGGKTRVRTLALGAARAGSAAPEGTAAPRPAAIDETLTLVAEPSTPAAAAARAARAAGEAHQPFARELAVAANTRGYRLLQEGKIDEALPLFEAAVALDGRYGMPRYNLARAHALQGHVEESVRHLRALEAMGKTQRARLEHATKDEAFQKIADSEAFRALFSP